MHIFTKRHRTIYLVLAIFAALTSSLLYSVFQQRSAHGAGIVTVDTTSTTRDGITGEGVTKLLDNKGIDGKISLREAIFNPRLYKPSVRFNPVERTWRGTFMSLRVPLGEFEKVVLIVQDDFGEQAKCPVGKITVQP